LLAFQSGRDNAKKIYIVYYPVVAKQGIIRSLVCFFPKLSVMKNQQVEGCEGIKAVGAFFISLGA